jgi:predicted HAD superfamily Cof-like phosphohydrolase
MKSQLKAVENFHVTFGQKINSYPTLLNVDEYLLRHRLMEEENSEYKEACENQSIVGIADALGDQLYILCGTILKHGLQHVIEDVFDEIQASNMSKLGPDGKPLLREDSKILKGPNYFKPDLESIINKALKK